ncbi:calmodulin-dependent protein kinase [Pelomyxa schiedti]|nr:calmodulin-dependent protein kinase [Pelomyxa schiedti]KAH3745072.1 calmodulin-dependent protein kinase [Pelomyxa schiedti]
MSNKVVVGGGGHKGAEAERMRKTLVIGEHENPLKTLGDITKLYPRDYAPPATLSLSLKETTIPDLDLVVAECIKTAQVCASTFPQLSLEHGAAVALYFFDFGNTTDENPYCILNKALITRNMLLPRFTPPGTVLFRGISERVLLDAGHYAKGNKIMWHTFCSVSTDMNATKNYLVTSSGNCDGTLFIIHNAWGYDVTPYAGSSSQEILLEPESTFEVGEIVDTGLIVIDLVMVGSSLLLSDMVSSFPAQQPAVPSASASVASPPPSAPVVSPPPTLTTPAPTQKEKRRPHTSKQLVVHALLHWEASKIKECIKSVEKAASRQKSLYLPAIMIYRAVVLQVGEKHLGIDPPQSLQSVTPLREEPFKHLIEKLQRDGDVFLSEGAEISNELEVLYPQFSNTSVSYFVGMWSYYVQKEFDSAYHIFHRLSRINHPPSMNSCALMLEKGEGTELKQRKAAVLFTKATAAGHAGATVNLGLCYWTGNGVEMDATRTENLLQQAGDVGHTGAHYLLAMLLISNGNPAQRPRAVSLLQMCANSADSHAMETVGDLYSDDTYLPRNAEEACEWYKRASALGNASATYKLGLMYEREYLDLPACYEQYLKAAQMGNFDALSQIGWCNEHGFVVPQDTTTAFRLYQEAATGGSNCGLYQLALCYEKGVGTPVDLEESRRMLGLAAAAGNQLAKEKIAAQATQVPTPTQTTTAAPVPTQPSPTPATTHPTPTTAASAANAEKPAAKTPGWLEWLNAVVGTETSTSHAAPPPKPAHPPPKPSSDVLLQNELNDIASGTGGWINTLKSVFF